MRKKSFEFTVIVPAGVFSISLAFLALCGVPCLAGPPPIPGIVCHNVTCQSFDIGFRYDRSIITSPGDTVDPDICATETSLSTTGVGIGIVLADNTNGNYGIAYFGSGDGGCSFISTQVVDTPADERKPHLACFETQGTLVILIVYESEGNIFAVRSVDGGLTFDVTPTLLSTGASSGDSPNPD